MILVSWHDFVDNQVRLQLFALVYNLGNFLKRLAEVRHNIDDESQNAYFCDRSG